MERRVMEGRVMEGRVMEEGKREERPSTRGSHIYVPCRSRIKIEPSNQSPFWRPIKRSR